MRQHQKQPKFPDLSEHAADVEGDEILEFIEVEVIRIRVAAGPCSFAGYSRFKELVDQQRTECPRGLVRKVLALLEIDQEDFALVHNLAQIDGCSGLAHEAPQRIAGQQFEEAVLCREDLIAKVLGLEVM